MKINKYYGSLIVAILTAFGYFCAYRYESGYLEYFGLPSALMELSIPVIIYSVGVVFSTFVTVAGMFVFGSKENERHPSLQYRISKMVVLIFALIYMVFLFGSDVKEYWWLIIVFGFLAIFDWVWPALVFADKHKTFTEKAIASDEAERKNITFWDYVIQHFGVGIINLIIFGFFVGMLAYYHGRADAKREKMFYVVESRSPNVVLRIYNGKFIIAPINKQTKTVEPQFSIINPESGSKNDAVVLTREKIGPITIEDVR